MQYLTLKTGAKMPMVGLGTWKSPPGAVGGVVEYALGEAGYCHLDCAAIYNNESEIGAALGRVLAHGQVKREDLFITSKLWNYSHARSLVRPACEQTLADLGLDYLDLYLMHWGLAIPLTPDPENPNKRGEPLDENGVLRLAKVPVRETWEAMEGLVAAGLVKAIGVSNFTAPMLVDLLSYARVPPAVNQIELHPYLPQSRLVSFCRHNSITVTAYSPLGSPGNFKDQPGHPVLLKDPKVLAIARQHHKFPAQALIRWALERGTAAIPKSLTPARLRENIEVFDFKLTPKEVAELSNLGVRHRYVDPWEWWQVPYFD